MYIVENFDNDYSEFGDHADDLLHAFDDAAREDDVNAEALS